MAEFVVNPEVQIHHLTIEWVPELFELIDRNRPHLSQFSDNTAQKYPDVQSLLDSVARPLNPDRERFIITYQDAVAGSINITPDDSDDSSSARPHEIGYYVSGEEDFKAKGIASTAAHILTNLYIDRPTVSDVIAYVHPKNYASQRVLEKVGFVRVDEYERYVFQRP